MALSDRLKQERTKLLQRLTQIEEILRQQEDLDRKIALVLGADAADLVTGSTSNPTDGGSRTAPDALPPVILRDERLHNEQRNDARRSVSPSVREFEDMVVAILLAAKAPMDRRSLLQAVTERGYVVPGKDPQNTLGARMSRMSGVRNVKHPSGNGYWLTSRAAELETVFD